MPPLNAMVTAFILEGTVEVRDPAWAVRSHGASDSMEPSELALELVDVPDPLLQLGRAAGRTSCHPGAVGVRLKAGVPGRLPAAGITSGRGRRSTTPAVGSSARGGKLNPGDAELGRDATSDASRLLPEVPRVTIAAVPACSLTVIAWRLSAAPLVELWLHYIDVGGNRPRPALAADLAGTATWPAAEHNVLAHALNEFLWDSGCASLAPYRPPDDVENSATAFRSDPPDQAGEHL